eukprot:TRINITY_DN30140_c0_g1_i1.p1 TRINITY_DN30140_c0_g1~~TRINITY_DN30140_c0_g1_i1.p1  ORF type:complete len:1515 (+),score=543.67 TRINITY_DN30140_c0_g1_i1:138-4682(+)
MMKTGESESDVVRKLLAVHANLTPKMREKATGRLPPLKTAPRRGGGGVMGHLAEGDCDSDAEQSPHSTLHSKGGSPARRPLQREDTMSRMNPLLQQLKTLFETREYDLEGMVRVGVSEQEFLDTFAPVFLPDASTEELNQWFHAIDYNCDGRVAWDELCTFLTNSKHLLHKGAAEFFSPNPVSYEGKGHQSCITHTIVNTTSDAYYTASTDGAIRLWNPNKVTGNSRVVHHCANDARVADMTWIPTLNRLMVLQTDRSVAFYDCAAFAGRGIGRSPLVKMFKGVCNLYDTVGCVDSRRGYKLSKRVMSYRMVERERQKEGFRIDAAFEPPKKDVDEDELPMQPLECVGTEATPLHELGFPTAIEYAPWLSGGTMLIGNEGGYVNSYSLRKLERAEQGAEDGSHYLPTRNRVHEGHSTITQIKAVNSMDGYISASTDETIQIFNVEKQQSYIRMRDDAPVQSLPSVGKRENRAVFGFDYSPELNLLATWGENRKFVIWNPLTATSLFNRMEHTQPLQQVLFKPNHQLLTLSVDKTIKVWDTRTFQCIQTLIDKHSRVRDDYFKSMAWDDDRKTIVTGNTSPVLFRLRSVQEQLETGRTLPPKHVAGHVQSIGMVLLNPTCGHVISVDRDCIITWELATGKQISSWYPDFLMHGQHKITTAAMCVGMRRLLVCTDRGSIYACNYSIHRVLHVYHTGVSEEAEINMLTPLIVNRGLACEENVLLASGVVPLIYAFKDHPRGGVAYDSSRPTNQMSLDRLGYAATVSLLQPNKLLVGTTKGYVLTFNVTTCTMIRKYCVATLHYGLSERPKPKTVTLLDAGDSSPPSRRWSRAADGSRSQRKSSLMEAVQSAVKEKEKEDRGDTLNASVSMSIHPSPSGGSGFRGRMARQAREDKSGSRDPPFVGDMSMHAESTRSPPSAEGASGPPLLSPLPSAMRAVGAVADIVGGNMRRRTSINPASIFANLQCGQGSDGPSMQEQVTRGADLVIDSFVQINPRVAATLQGNGDVRIWKLGRDSSQVAPVLCFPGSYAEREPARCLHYNEALETLYVGDCDGYVSVFSIAGCIRNVEKDEMRDRCEAKEQRLRRESMAFSTAGEPPPRKRKPAADPFAASLAFPGDAGDRGEALAGEADQMERSFAGATLSPERSVGALEGSRRRALSISGTTKAKRRLSNARRVAPPQPVETPVREINEATMADAGLDFTSCFRAHPTAVTNIQTAVAPAGQIYIVTGGTEGRLKLWTADGIHIGSFGHMSFWTNVFCKVKTWRGQEVRTPGEEGAAAPPAAADPASAGVPGEGTEPTSPSSAQEASTSGQSQRVSRRLSEMVGQQMDPRAGEKDPDTREAAMAGHSFRKAFPPRLGEESTTFGDVLAFSKMGGLTHLSPKASPRGSPRSLSPSMRPQLVPATPSSTDNEERSLQRMLSYAAKKLDHNPEMLKDLQELEAQDAEEQEASLARAALEGRIAVSLSKAKQRQGNKNPTSSQYSSLRLPPPNLGLKPHVKPFRPGKMNNLIELMTGV